MGTHSVLLEHLIHRLFPNPQRHTQKKTSMLFTSKCCCLETNTDLCYKGAHEQCCLNTNTHLCYKGAHVIIKELKIVRSTLSTSASAFPQLLVKMWLSAQTKIWASASRRRVNVQCFGDLHFLLCINRFEPSSLAYQSLWNYLINRFEPSSLALSIALILLALPYQLLWNF